MASSDRLLDLLGHDIVRGDVADVVHVPVKPDEIVEHKLSIYDARIYTQAHVRP